MPTTNTIYLVRHGENPANITHEFSYKDVDYSLTPKGREQARQTAAYFRQLPIDEIYSSPLKRAKETADAIAAVLHLPVTVMEDFREINIGSLEGQPPNDENWALHNHIVYQWFAGNGDISFPDGENYYSLLARMRHGLRAITQGKNGRHIVISGHGGIFARTVKDICPSVNMDLITRTEVYNCSISTVELTTSDDEVVGVVEQWASHAHLHDDASQFVPGTVLGDPLASKKY